jgi:hypothetical protein
VDVDGGNGCPSPVARPGASREAPAGIPGSTATAGAGTDANNPAVTATDTTPANQRRPSPDHNDDLRADTGTTTSPRERMPEN